MNSFRVCIALFPIFCLVSCQSRTAGHSSQASRRAPFTADDLVRLDRITTLETVFPHASDRRLYESRPAVTEQRRRGYSIALKTQSGMETPRHFQLITITWTRIPTSGQPDWGLTGTGGPGGGFIEKTVHTADGRYVIRIVMGELLPGSARTAEMDAERMAASLLDAYAQTGGSRH